MSPPSFFHREIFSRFLARLPLQPASAPTVVLIHSDFNPSHGLELLNTIAATLVASSLTQGFIAYISSRRLQPSLHWCLLSCSASATEFSLLVWHFTDGCSISSFAYELRSAQGPTLFIQLTSQ
ncbi:unnamed protein product [Arabidopsis lyrata]|nr:unnamed protein product [Arabidopsis lyrata]